MNKLILFFCFLTMMHKATGHISLVVKSIYNGTTDSLIVYDQELQPIHIIDPLQLCHTHIVKNITLPSIILALSFSRLNNGVKKSVALFKGSIEAVSYPASEFDLILQLRTPPTLSPRDYYQIKQRYSYAPILSKQESWTFNIGIYISENVEDSHIAVSRAIKIRR
ncbi:MAG: hypothetical protein ACOYT8_04800 [Candidatus Dependentiae bacterium]